MSDVPADLLPDIFIRLPVEVLAQLRCVCKSWRSLLDDQRFLKLHMIRRRQLDDDDKLYFISRRQFSKEFYSISLSSNCYSEHQLRNTSIKAISIYDDYLRQRRLSLPSCDGLILLVPETSYYVDPVMYWAIYNPFLGDFHQLPPLPGNGRTAYHNADIGYDCVHDDYKVVRFSWESEISGFRAYLYSLKSDEWHKIKDYSNHVPLNHNPGVFFNGAFHWVAYMRLDGGQGVRKILTLDLSTENYRQLPIPSCLNDASPHSVHLDALGGELFISNSAAGTLDIWMMKDYGGTNTWSKLLSSCHRININRYDGYPKLMAYFKEKMEVLIMYNSSDGEYEKAFLFDLKTKLEMEVPLEGPRGHIICKPVPARLIRLNALREGSL